MAHGKYHDWIKPNGLMMIESWARDGLKDEQIAKNMDISRVTLYKWAKNFKEIKKALQDGKRPVDLEVENALLKRATGQWVTETDTIIEQLADGKTKKKIIKHERYIPPDTTAAIFWLKNRKAEQWQRTSEDEARKLAIEAKKLEVELQKLTIELDELKEDKGTNIIIVDSWSDEDEE